MYTYTHLGATKPTFHSHFSLLVESTGVHRPLVGQEVSRSGGAGHLGHSLVIREGDCLPLSLLRLAIFSKGDLRAGVPDLQGHKDTGTQVQGWRYQKELYTDDMKFKCACMFIHTVHQKVFELEK